MSIKSVWLTRFRVSPGKLLFLVCICTLLLSGCASNRLVQVRSTPRNPLASTLNLSTWKGPKPTGRTEQILRRFDLGNHSANQLRTKSIPALVETYERTPDQEICYAIAELNYITAKKMETTNPGAAFHHYMGCVTYAYEYLFHPRFTQSTNPYDPQFRGACDLYNMALESGLRQAQKMGRFKPGHKFLVDTSSEKVEFSIQTKGFNWQPQDFADFKFVSDYRLTGLANRYETFGLGVPLIAIRRSQTAGAAQEKFYAPNLSFPITAFLRFPPNRSSKGPRQAILELHDPLEKTRIDVADYQIPLQSDISTPLAFFLDNPKLKNLDTYGLIWANKAKEISGLYMVQPYQPDKIPVLMVHGLWSSPMTWMEMMNDLRGIPEIRDRYQFWFYLYPSGQPYWETTADLRDSLKEMKQTIQLAGSQKNFNNMVVVGHSMGGLVSRMLTSDSKNIYWEKVSPTPFQLVNASEEEKYELQRMFFFNPEPSIKRVVTIGSPHRGSSLANNFTRWLGSKLISLPGRTLTVGKNLLQLNPNLFHEDFSIVNSTSIDSLSPKSPILQANLESPKGDWVKYHNIVGVTSNKPLAENSDGVVAYNSAHLENVESEIVVHADHSNLHRHPRSVLEVKRILLEHLSDVDATRTSDIIPLSHSNPANQNEQTPPPWEEETKFTEVTAPAFSAFPKPLVNDTQWRPGQTAPKASQPTWSARQKQPMYR